MGGCFSFFLSIFLLCFGDIVFDFVIMPGRLKEFLTDINVDSGSGFRVGIADCM